MNIVEVPIDSIRAADWRATHMLLPDLKLLTQSMVEYGWISPIIVRKKDSVIIDGFHRWLIAQKDAEFRKRHGKKTVPVVFMDIDLIDAMVMHIRLNRARGVLMARYISLLAKDILASKKYQRTEIKRLLAMSEDELAVLLDGSLLKHRKISEYEYSKAWVPVEVPASTPIEAVSFEAPPNADR